jgi:hypothetical protein
MTGLRDPEALLAVYLAEGMEVLPDRVADAVLDQVHRTRQLAPSGSRRILTMPRLAFSAAGAIAVLVIGAAAWLVALGPRGDVGDSSPSPTASASPSLAEFPSTTADLIVGASYRTTTFSQPLTLTIPVYINEIGAANGGLFDRVTGSIEGGGNTLRIDLSPTNQSITIHDDATVNVDPCQPSAAVQEIPDTPAAVGAWLHGIAGLEVRDLGDRTLNRLVATGYRVTTGPSCGAAEAAGNPDIVFRPGEEHTIWAIPTDTDTILVVEWYRDSDDPRTRPILMQGIASRVMFSLRFD